MPRSMPVATVMTADVLTFAPDDTVEAAMMSMVERGIDGAPVVDDVGKVVGMLSTGDLIVQESQVHVPTVISLFGAYLELPSAHRKFDQDLRKALGGRVAEVMHDEPVTVGADDTLETAATLMHDHDVSRLPVVRDDRLVGVISRNDILRAILTDRS
jgi:CBS domain-containing protein